MSPDWTFDLTDLVAIGVAAVAAVISTCSVFVARRANSEAHKSRKGLLHE